MIGTLQLYPAPLDTINNNALDVGIGDVWVNNGNLTVNGGSIQANANRVLVAGDNSPSFSMHNTGSVPRYGIWNSSDLLGLGLTNAAGDPTQSFMTLDGAGNCSLANSLTVHAGGAAIVGGATIDGGLAVRDTWLDVAYTMHVDTGAPGVAGATQVLGSLRVDGLLDISATDGISGFGATRVNVRNGMNVDGVLFVHGASGVGGELTVDNTFRSYVGGPGVPGATEVLGGLRVDGGVGIATGGIDVTGSATL
jgi:hypothetical protein